VDPVPGPLFLGKSSSDGHPAQDLWICSHEPDTTYYLKKKNFHTCKEVGVKVNVEKLVTRMQTKTGI
jgi:hypothetical protein